MTFRLIPPGTRKNNPFYIVRGALDGRGYEFSAKTLDEAEARTLAERFEAALAASQAASAHVAAQQLPPTRIYFIGDEHGRVKIGLSENPEARRAALQTGSGAVLRLLASLPGTYEDERNLQIRFRDYRVRGEWFQMRGSLRAFVESLDG